MNAHGLATKNDLRDQWPGSAECDSEKRCYCGALQDLYDAENKRTHWDYDITGRVTRKVFPDGKEINYAYEPLSGRLGDITDAKGQVKHFSYYKDSKLKEISYIYAELPTPNMSFTYDPVYGRREQMTDGNGITGYAYHPNDGTTLGAGMLASRGGRSNSPIKFPSASPLRF